MTYADEARVAAFIAAHNLGDWVERAIQLAWDAFPGAQGITLCMFGDPGEYGERVYLDVSLNVSREEGRRQDYHCLTRWIDATPPWVTDLMGISRTHL